MRVARLACLVALASSAALPGCALTLDFGKFEGGEAMDGGRDAGPDGEVRIDGCTPAEETCNGADDDCDGTMDEEPTECSVENGVAACGESGCGFGSCNEGFDDCDDVPLTCEAPLDRRDHCGSCEARCGAAQACGAEGCHDIAQEWAFYLSGETPGYLGVSTVTAAGETIYGGGGYVGPNPMVGAVTLPTPPGSSTFWSAIFGSNLDGEVLWARAVRGAGNSTDVTASAGDDDGNAYFGGRTSQAGSILYGDTGSSSVLRSDSAGNAFLLSVGPTGAMRWGYHLGQAGSVNDIARGPSDDVFVAFGYQGELRIDTNLYPDRTRPSGAAVARIRANGAVVWVADWESATQPASRVAVDAEGRVYVLGQLGNAFVVHALEADGTARWDARFDAPNGFTGGPAIATSDGILVVRGSASGQVSYGEALLDAPFLVGLAVDDGALVWSRQDEITSLRIEPAPGGGLLRAGQMRDTVDFGYGPLLGPGSGEVIVERMTADGAHVWAAVFGSPDSDEASDVAEASDGSVVVAGRTLGNMSFAGATHLELGGSDGFVARLRP